jgi:hypothetical protein
MTRVRLHSGLVNSMVWVGTPKGISGWFNIAQRDVDSIGDSKQRAILNEDFGFSTDYVPGTHRRGARTKVVEQ